MTRAQAAVEFMLITTALLVLFAGVFIFAEAQFLNISEERVDTSAYDFLSRLVRELSVAEQLGDGYNRELYLPATLSGEPYSIILNENQVAGNRDELILIAYNKRYLIFSPVNVQGRFQEGLVIISGGDPVQISPVLGPSDSCALTTVCHGSSTVCVPVEAAQTHVTEHGDTLGAC